MDDEQASTIKASYLEWVAMMHNNAEAAIVNRTKAIAMAREWGATWEELGETMGMTRQAAHRRFGRPPDHPNHTLR